MGKYRSLGTLFNRVFRNDLNANFDAVDADINAQKTRVDNLIVGTPQPSEVVDARGTFTVLSDRLNGVDSSLTNKAKQIQNITFLVTDYGAIGDGTTDDSAAIQACVNAAGGYKRVRFPKPSVAYKVSTPITFKTGQEIEADPNTNIYDYVSNDYCFKIEGGDTFVTNALNYVQLRNLKFLGKSLTNLGAVKIRNAYVVDLENITVTQYSDNASTHAIHVEDFFQVSLKTCHISSITKGTGLYVDSVLGNSGQINLYNTIIQRCAIDMSVNGSGNITDGVNIYGGAIGNSYSKGLVITKNVHNFVAIGTHIENHDGITFSGDTAVSMELADGTVAEGITFLNCYFINCKYGIKSNNTKRVSLIGNQFDGRSISGNVAITQGASDAAWFIAPNMFTGFTTEIIEAGTNHTNIRKLNVNDSGAIFPQRSTAGMYSGSVYPEGAVTANQGSTYQRTNGADGSTVYYKTSGTGNTGWKAVQVVSSGTTAQRPTSVPTGFQYYDASLNKPVWWNGSAWKDSAGTTV